jgi:hypothetical protein
MKLTDFTKRMLAYRKEKRDMEAQGYYGHGVTLGGTETIQDVKVAKDGKSIWIKTTEARSA